MSKFTGRYAEMVQQIDENLEIAGKSLYGAEHRIPQDATTGYLVQTLIHQQEALKTLLALVKAV